MTPSPEKCKESTELLNTNLLNKTNSLPTLVKEHLEIGENTQGKETGVDFSSQELKLQARLY